MTDPEQFLANSSYLLNTVTPSRGRSATGPASRWRIVVLEDAGEFLMPDAKHVQGQALSRLLNVCDGVLGQAMRALVVVTTNEPLRALHPALSRPGRCVAEIEFTASRASTPVASASHRSLPTLPAKPSWSLAELYAHARGPRDLPRPRSAPSARSGVDVADLDTGRAQRREGKEDRPNERPDGSLGVRDRGRGGFYASGRCDAR